MRRWYPALYHWVQWLSATVVIGGTWDCMHSSMGLNKNGIKDSLTTQASQTKPNHRKALPWPPVTLHHANKAAKIMQDLDVFTTHMKRLHHFILQACKQKPVNTCTLVLAEETCRLSGFISSCCGSRAIKWLRKDYCIINKTRLVPMVWPTDVPQWLFHNSAYHPVHGSVAK